MIDEWMCVSNATEKGSMSQKQQKTNKTKWKRELSCCIHWEFSLNVVWKGTIMIICGRRWFPSGTHVIKNYTLQYSNSNSIISQWGSFLNSVTKIHGGFFSPLHRIKWTWSWRVYIHIVYARYYWISSVSFLFEHMTAHLLCWHSFYCSLDPYLWS